MPRARRRGAERKATPLSLVSRGESGSPCAAFASTAAEIGVAGGSDVVLAEVDECRAVALFERSDHSPMFIARFAQVIAARGRKETGAVHLLSGAADGSTRYGFPQAPNKHSWNARIRSKGPAMIIRLHRFSVQHLNSVSILSAGGEGAGRRDLLGGERFERFVTV